MSKVQSRLESFQEIGVETSGYIDRLSQRSAVECPNQRSTYYITVVRRVESSQLNNWRIFWMK